MWNTLDAGNISSSISLKPQEFVVFLCDISDIPKIDRKDKQPSKSPTRYKLQTWSSSKRSWGKPGAQLPSDLSDPVRSQGSECRGMPSRSPPSRRTMPWWSLAPCPSAWAVRHGRSWGLELRMAWRIEGFFRWPFLGVYTRVWIFQKCQKLIYTYYITMNTIHIFYRYKKLGRHLTKDSGVAGLLGALWLSGHHQHAGGQDCALVKILTSNSMLAC